MTVFVTTTGTSAMRAMGAPADRSLPRLQAILARDFPAGLAFELAEPVQRQDGSGIDWYADYDGKLLRLTDLPPETAKFYRDHLNNSIRAVRQAIQKYEERGNETGLTTANALRNAITFPGDDNVWIASEPAPSGKMVLTGWGYAHHEVNPDVGRSAEIVGLATPQHPMVDKAVRAPIAAEVQTVGQSWWRGPLAWILWLLPLAFTVLIAWLLLPACGIRFADGTTLFGSGGREGYCALAAPVPVVDAADVRSRELQTEVAVLEEQVRNHLNTCVPPSPPSHVDPPSPLPDMLKRIKDNNIIQGKANVTLTWYDKSDLDLYVKCPNGEEVPLPPGVACGAVHDHDMNRDAESASSSPIEHITWAENPEPGHYIVYVQLFGRHGVTTPSIPFDVMFDRDGQPPTTVKRSISKVDNGQHFQEKILEFDVP